MTGNNVDDEIRTQILPSIYDDSSILSELLGGQRNRLSTVQQRFNHIADLVKDFCYREDRIVPSTQFNLIDFWYLKRYDKKFKSLFDLSQVVFGSPYTQVKIERTFSVFALVLTHLRTNLTNEALNAIIVVRDNIDLIDKINFV